ncbi:hypothetical protein [Halioxenophilus aromaticivorans]|uniref:Glycerophosphoryl diester phosphodiesterase membrane domain-containing protein n=1 Tax=Halioxenophilus aromaticivorans TaxID=1306992 RepID=A0AAV3U399_9ALTE
MGDIYQAPSAELEQEYTAPEGQWSTLEKGIRGEYHLKAGEVLSEAWALTKGAKLKIHLGLLIYFLVYILISFVAQFATVAVGLAATPGLGADGTPPDMAALGAIMAGAIVVTLIVVVLTSPLVAGLQMMGVRRAAGAEFPPTTVLQYFGRILPLAVVSLVLVIVIYIGFILLIIPGLFLAIATSMTIPLIAEKQLGAWRAVLSSIKAVTKKWFTVFGIFFLLGLINIAVVIPIFIGTFSGSMALLGFGVLFCLVAYFWTIPFSIIAFGTTYRNIFGYENKQ